MKNENDERALKKLKDLQAGWASFFLKALKNEFAKTWSNGCSFSHCKTGRCEEGHKAYKAFYETYRSIWSSDKIKIDCLNPISGNREEISVREYGNKCLRIPQPYGRITRDQNNQTKQWTAANIFQYNRHFWDLNGGAPPSRPCVKLGHKSTFHWALLKHFLDNFDDTKSFTENWKLLKSIDGVVFTEEDIDAFIATKTISYEAHVSSNISSAILPSRSELPNKISFLYLAVMPKITLSIIDEVFHGDDHEAVEDQLFSEEFSHAIGYAEMGRAVGQSHYELIDDNWCAFGRRRGTVGLEGLVERGNPQPLSAFFDRERFLIKYTALVGIFEEGTLTKGKRRVPVHHKGLMSGFIDEENSYPGTYLTYQGNFSWVAEPDLSMKMAHWHGVQHTIILNDPSTSNQIPNQVVASSSEDRYESLKKFIIENEQNLLNHFGAHKEEV